MTSGGRALGPMPDGETMERLSGALEHIKARGKEV